MEEKNQETVIDKVENRMVKFSIIVPAYKVEAYLDRCVDSLIHQTIDPEQLEILLVDDGSPDRCGALCDQYAEQYPFVKALHKGEWGLVVCQKLWCGKSFRRVDHLRGFRRLCGKRSL